MKDYIQLRKLPVKDTLKMLLTDKTTVICFWMRNHHGKYIIRISKTNWFLKKTENLNINLLMRIFIYIYFFMRTNILLKAGRESDNSNIYNCQLTDEEIQCLNVILNSGVYGSMEIKINNEIQNLKVHGKPSKWRYIFKRTFTIPEIYKRKNPRFYKHRLTRPLIMLIRYKNAVINFKKFRNELRVLRKIK